MFALVSFRVASDSTFTDPTTLTVIGSDLDFGGPDVALVALPDHVDAIVQLLGQDRFDGEITTAIQVTGGPLVTFAMPDANDSALDTVKVHGSLATPWTRDKAQAYLDGLLSFGLA